MQQNWCCCRVRVKRTGRRREPVRAILPELLTRGSASTFSHKKTHNLEKNNDSLKQRINNYMRNSQVDKSVRLHANNAVMLAFGQLVFESLTHDALRFEIVTASTQQVNKNLLLSANSNKHDSN